MTQEDKELLFKDISARLSYGIKGIHREQVHIITTMDSNSLFPSIKVDGYDAWFPVETFKPYLRLMSSMTEEERKYIEDKCAFTTIGPIGDNFGLVMPVIATEWLTDFYNSHHLDWRGLIEKGLAIEAPEGMYKVKEQ